MTPADAMDDLISAYADGELDEASATTVENYLADHPEALDRLAMHREMSALLRTAFAVPPATAQATEPRSAAAKLVPVSTRLRQRFRMPAYGWAIAASIAAGVIGYGTGATWPGLVGSEQSQMLAEVAEYHEVYSKETVHLVEVGADQVDHLKAWLGKRIKGPLPIPDFKQAGLTFAGARMAVLEGAPVAQLMYTRADGPPIAFCVFHHPGKPTGMVVERHGEMHVAMWDDGVHGYIVVGEADAAVIRSLASMAQRQI
ncbi:MAG: anti-sigma factor [Acetobacteraceae bacterium]